MTKTSQSCSSQNLQKQLLSKIIKGRETHYMVRILSTKS